MFIVPKNVLSINSHGFISQLQCKTFICMEIKGEGKQRFGTVGLMHQYYWCYTSTPCEWHPLHSDTGILPHREEMAVATLKRYSWSCCLCHPHCSIKELLRPNGLKHKTETKWHIIWQVKKTRSWSTGELQPQLSRNNVYHYTLTDMSWKQGFSLSLQGGMMWKVGEALDGSTTMTYYCLH